MFRVGRITASKVYDVMRTSKTKPAPSLIAQICQTARPVCATSVRWGVAYESLTLIMYDSAQREFHSNYECLLCRRPTHTWLGHRMGSVEVIVVPLPLSKSSFPIRTGMCTPLKCLVLQVHVLPLTVNYVQTIDIMRNVNCKCCCLRFRNVFL